MSPGQASRLSYLISQAPFLDNVHAHVQDILDEFFGLGAICRRLLFLLLALASPQQGFPQDLEVPGLDGNTHNLFEVAVLIAALEDAPDRALEVLLDVPLEHER